MKKLIFLISILMGLSGAMYAQTNAVKKANDLYSKGDYTAAAAEYENILKDDGVAPELYLNLGNAYFKQNETAKAILNYERALRLDPMYDNARANLEFAQQKVVDNIVQIPAFFIFRWIENLMKMLTSNQWYVVSLIVLIACLAGALMFIFGSTNQIRRMSFYFALVLMIMTVVTISFAGIRKTEMLTHNDAIVMTGVVVVKSSPDKSGTDLFQLHEGTKVKIKSNLGSWTEIELGNGSIGWLENSAIEKI